jgi:superfamily II DNA or RNA helicase
MPSQKPKQIHEQEHLRLSSIENLSCVQSRKNPLPHQKKAINDSLKVLAQPGGDIRAQTHMACGTGKTLVGLWVSERLGDRTLLCEPSLALIAQNLKEWRANARDVKPDVLVVCSDKSTVSIGQDQIHVRPEELQARVTTDASEVQRFLKDTSRPKLLLSTYHSLPVVAEAMSDRRVSKLTCSVVDEAHRTAAVSENDFSIVHYQEAIRSRARFYLTATPKIFDTRSDGDREQILASMDNHDVFGVVAHSLTFSKAIEQGLLSDYRLVVATLTEESLYTKKATQKLSQEALSQLAVLRAIEKYNLSKILSFHSTVARAYEFANSIGDIGAKYLHTGRLWTHGVDGKMPSAVRSGLLNALKHNSRRQISIISNCRCLTEGVDVPALDGVVFADPKKSEIDVVQAIGRVIRKESSKKIGTIIVPLVVPNDVDTSDYLERSSAFKPVAQVLRALKAHDDRFQVRLKANFLDEGKKKNEGKAKRGTNGGAVVFLGLDDLTPVVAKIITAKTLKIGFGLKKLPLTEPQIIEAAKSFHQIHGKWPTQYSEEPVPGMPGENWSSIDTAGQTGLRGIARGRSLSRILEHLKDDNLLTEEQIVRAAKAFFKIHGQWPTRHSKESVPGMPEATWSGIHYTSSRGYRGLVNRKSLAAILEPFSGQRKWGRPLTEKLIIEAARAFFKKHKKWPGQASKESVPGIPGETWDAINQAGQRGLRGIKKGRTLSKILAPLKGLPKATRLTEKKIIKAARCFFKEHGKWPTNRSKESVPGMPNENWPAISSAGRRGNRGLEKGRTLAKILLSFK